MRDISQRSSQSFLMEPKTVTSTQTATGVDLAGYDGAYVVVRVGAFTDGTYTPALQESADNSAWNAVAAADMAGAFTAIATPAASTTQVVGYIGAKRYVRTVLTAGGATTGMSATIILVKGIGRKLPSQNAS